MNDQIKTHKTKTTRGRQKIEIKKIANNGNRQVTFTKRRGGLFKKAAEVCVLTGAEVAVFVKSPGGRVFAFEHPDIGSLVDKFFGGGNGGRSSAESSMNEDFTRGFNGRFDDVARELEAEKRRGEVIAESSVLNGGFWWEDAFRDGELESKVAAAEELMKNINNHADHFTLLLPPLPSPTTTNNKSSFSSSFQQHQQQPYSCPLMLPPPQPPINNPTSHQVKYSNDELTNYHFNNQPNLDFNSVVPLGYGFGPGGAHST